MKKEEIENVSRRDFLGYTGIGASALALSLTLSKAYANDCIRPQSNIEGCDPKIRKPFRKKTGLCLSGGGYRAMLYHIGTLLRLYESGLLHSCNRITSVSGGSIAAGILALRWNKLPSLPIMNSSYSKEAREFFLATVVQDARKLAKETIDIPSVLSGVFLPGNVSSNIEEYYEELLFKGKTLQSLPKQPEFVFLATNLQSGVLFQMSRKKVFDYRIGLIKDPDFSLSKVVAASSAFPPILSPSEWNVDATGKYAFKANLHYEPDLHFPPYTTEVKLVDGGVYDNLGLEPLKNFKTVFVSDAGGKMQPNEDPDDNWFCQILRVLDLIDNQVRGLRKRWLITEYNTSDNNLGRKGSYWSTRTKLECFPKKLWHDFTIPLTTALAHVPTNLRAFDDDVIEGLINWGYLSCSLNLWKYYCMGDDFVLPYPVRMIDKKEEKVEEGKVCKESDLFCDEDIF